MMKIRNLVAAMSMALSVGAFAANDGLLGVEGGTVSSEGDLDISLNVPELIQITDLDNIGLGAWDGVIGNNLSGADDFCVYINTSVGFYSVEGISDEEDSGNFRLTNGAGTPSFIIYTVAFDGDLGDGAAGTTLTSSTPTGATFVGDADGGRDCDSTNNASVTITVNGTDMNAVPAGDYTDTLTLRVAPL